MSLLVRLMYSTDCLQLGAAIHLSPIPRPPVPISPSSLHFFSALCFSSPVILSSEQGHGPPSAPNTPRSLDLNLILGVSLSRGYMIEAEICQAFTAKRPSPSLRVRFLPLPLVPQNLISSHFFFMSSGNQSLSLPQNPSPLCTGP